MTTPPVFVANTVLSAAQMNAVGLWLVKSEAVGTGVASVTLTSVFTSDYNNYKIVWEGGKTSLSATALLVSLGGIAGSIYYSSSMYQSATSATVVTSNNAAAAAWVCGVTGNQVMRVEIDFTDPNASGPGKTANTKFASYDNTNSTGGTAAHWVITGSTTTAFTFAPFGGTLTGGTIRVYGYRN